MTKYTPGPWRAAQPKHDPQAWDVVADGGGVLAKLVWGGEGGANAKLMAAAPTLLSALETVKRVLQGEQAMDIMLTEKGPCLGDVIRDAMHAATNGSPAK